MKFGKPGGLDLMRWRWKPDDCDLPRFDAGRFLEAMRGKSMAFVGDSLARNHVKSLLCILSQVAEPVELVTTTETDVTGRAVDALRETEAARRRNRSGAELRLLDITEAMELRAAAGFL
ncbi:hypothetical protein TRIUR3_16572 [Triticum urartu]|uniref:Trichome birefringence-like C-terminal domain-containing protein n=1 Tax=Triticum urartu TaxID=4572 RepID=M7ZG94_TRIUA|nr:hypothetical protein TRIUR3_16572 [Triticum urartu]